MVKRKHETFQNYEPHVPDGMKKLHTLRELRKKKLRELRDIEKREEMEFAHVSDTYYKTEIRKKALFSRRIPIGSDVPLVVPCDCDSCKKRPIPIPK